jgi:GNAT superfamily N-acetyltransferase
MCDEWMPCIKLPIAFAEFEQLPRNASFKYEYFHGVAYLSPRPRHFHAILDMQPLAVPEAPEVQRLREDNIDDLVSVFADAFLSVQPYGSLDEAGRKKAARQALERARSGGDGPWIKSASFIAREKDKVIGAIWITLLPDGDPCEASTYYWECPPPADCLERRLGHPHLTWIFVSPSQKGHGVGTALLAAAVRELLALGYHRLLSTFISGNDSSMLWHWRNGFRLLAHPASRRLSKQRWQELHKPV